MKIELELQNIYALSDEDINFVRSFGSAKKPMELDEFMKFWRSLTPDEQMRLWFDYDEMRSV